MARYFQTVLMIFCIIDIGVGLNILLGGCRHYKDNIYFAVYAFSGAIWSLFFGLIPVQQTADAAYICRCIGLIGTFGSMIFCMFLLAEWSQLDSKLKKYLKYYAFLGIAVYVMACNRSGVRFYASKYGFTYSFESNIFNNIYNVYCFMNMILVLLLIVRTRKKGNKRRIRFIGWFILAELLLVVIGSIFDTVLPMLGYGAIPGSTFTQFFGTMVMFCALLYTNRNKQTVSSISGRLFHSVKLNILIYSDTGELVLISDEARKTLKLENAEYTYTKLSDIFEFEDNPFNDNYDYRLIPTRVRKTGMSCDLEINILRDNFGDISGLFAVAYDTDERTHFIEDLNAERDRADRANIAKTAFLANMSHEIRTPINTVLGMNEMIRRESRSETISGYSSNIKNAGEALLSIINDILDFSKVEAGKMEIVNAPYDVRKLFTGLFEMFSLRSSEKGLEFKPEIDVNLPTELIGDEIRIRQILINLLSNAVKYTSIGSVTLRAKCISQSEDKCRIRFEVIDTGMGIKEENKEMLFSSFQRFDLEKNRNIEGTGLGLSIVKKLTELMGSDIKVESIYGSGSDFFFELDQTIKNAQPIGSIHDWNIDTKEQGQEYFESFIAPRASVLVVDDNRMNLEVIKGLLKKTEINLDLAASGAECIKLAESRTYNIILLDHMMPGMDGIETLRNLKNLPKEQNASYDAKVIALTANALFGVREMYISYGFDEYLSKPIEGIRLEEMIKRFLPEALVEQPRKPNCGACGIDDFMKRNENSSATPDDHAVMIALGERAINPIKGLEYCGNLEIYRITALTFVQCAAEMCTKLAEYRNARDCDSYRIQIHAVKSNAKTLGCMWLEDFALRQEESCKAGEFGPIIGADTQPEQMIARLCEGLKGAFRFTEDEIGSSEPEAGPASTDIPEEALKGMIQKAAQALEDFDDETAAGVVSAMLGYNLDSNDKADAEEALGLIKKFDYDGARALMDKLYERHTAK